MRKRKELQGDVGCGASGGEEERGCNEGECPRDCRWAPSSSSPSPSSSTLSSLNWSNIFVGGDLGAPGTLAQLPAAKGDKSKHCQRHYTHLGVNCFNKIKKSRESCNYFSRHVTSVQSAIWVFAHLAYLQCCAFSNLHLAHFAYFYNICINAMFNWLS